MIGHFLARFEWIGFEGIVLVLLVWQLISLRREQRRDREAQSARETQSAREAQSARETRDPPA